LVMVVHEVTHLFLNSPAAVPVFLSSPPSNSSLTSLSSPHPRFVKLSTYLLNRNASPKQN